MNPLVAGGVALALAAVGSSALSLTQSLLRTEQTTRTTLDGPVRDLLVEVDSGDVRVVAGDRDDVLVERTETWSLSRPEVSETVTDGVLRVRADCAAALSWCEVSYVLQVPDGTPVVARTGSGDLALRGTGDVRADTGSGDVALSGVEGDADVRTGSGDVSADGGAGGSLALRTGSGDVTVTGARAPRVSARTGSGDVDLGLRAVPEQVRARTGSGDVEVTVPDEGQAYAVDVDTGSGDRDVEVATSPRAPRSVSVQTGSGDVAVRYADWPR